MRFNLVLIKVGVMIMSDVVLTQAEVEKLLQSINDGITSSIQSGGGDYQIIEEFFGSKNLKNYKRKDLELTKDDVKNSDKSLTPQEEVSIDNFYESHKKEQGELRNMISQAEIDALLRGDCGSDEFTSKGDSNEPWEYLDSTANSKNTVSPEVISSHLKLEMCFQAAKSDITEAMEILHKESQQLLESMKDGFDNKTLAKNTQDMLGMYYTFLSTCHNELRQLDRIIEHEKKVYDERVSLEKHT